MKDDKDDPCRDRHRSGWNIKLPFRKLYYALGDSQVLHIHTSLLSIHLFIHHVVRCPRQAQALTVLLYISQIMHHVHCFTSSHTQGQLVRIR